MADASYAQTSFLGGEWSKMAQGRFDRPDYRTAMNVCLNAYPIEQGSWTRRPGSQHGSTTRNGVAGRVISFDFRQDIPYTLEFTAGYLRFRNGATLVTTNDDQSVIAISSANPAEVTTGNTHNWSSGQAVQFINLGTDCALLQSRIFKITVTSATKFTLSDPITGAGIDGTALGTVPGAAVVQRILEVVTPYTGTLWQDARLVQSETTAILLHPKVAPQALEASVAPISLTALPPPIGKTIYTFTLATAPLVDGPYLDPLTNGALLTPSAVNGIITLSLAFSAYDAARAYQKGDFVLSASVNYQSLVDQNQNNLPASSPGQWKAVAAGLAVGPNGFVGTDVGRMLRLKDSAGHWTWGKIVSLATLIDPALAGSSNIGNMTAGGGLAAAFDGVVNQAAAACAAISVTNFLTLTGYVGKDYGASPQKVATAVMWPSNDAGFISATKTYTTTAVFYAWSTGAGQWIQGGTATGTTSVPMNVASLTVNLRGKASSPAPASPSDGVLLASTIVVPNAPITLTSSDQTTSYRYLWFEFIATGFDQSVPAAFDGRNGFTTPPADGTTTYAQSSVLDSFSVSEFVAEAQFFNPAGTGTSGNGVNFQILGPALADTSTRSEWQLGLYSDTTGWPTCGTFHEGRLWLSGSTPNRVDGSMSNNKFTFAPSLTTGQVVDSSAIAATFNAKNVNSIFWLEPDQIGIIAGTQGGDWLIQASNNNNPLTPTSIQAHPYSRIACANIEPRRADYGPLIVVPRFKRKIYEHFPDVYSGKVSAQNITVTMRHLTRPGVEEIAYQRELTPIIWARMGDGSLVGITYKRESNVSAQLPSFAAGHRHLLGSGRVVESIAVGPSADGAIDALTMVTNDPQTGIRHVELLTPMLEEGAPETDAWFVDDGVVPSSSLVSGDNFILNGLWHLNGKTPTVFAGGLNCGTWPVTNGTITMTFGDGVDAGTGGGRFTADFVNSFAGTMPIVVGFAHMSQGQIVRPATPAESGARNGPALGKKRRAHQFAVLLENTGPISFGATFDKLLPALFRSASGVNFPEGQMFSGVYRNTIRDDYSFESMPCWQITGPYSATVVAIEGFLQTQDV